MYIINIYNQNKSVVVNSYQEALELAQRLRKIYHSDVFIDDEFSNTVEHLYAIRK